MTRNLAVGLILCALLSGCAGGGSVMEAQGSLSGTLLIQWTAEDRFIYVPDPKRPLTYVRGERRIVPGRMYTDGGSIPRVFWSAKGFSPWAYGPAYAVHDWLFNEHRCGRDAADAPMTLAEANEILDNSIGILVARKRRTRMAKPAASFAGPSTNSLTRRGMANAWLRLLVWP